MPVALFAIGSCLICRDENRRRYTHTTDFLFLYMFCLVRSCKNGFDTGRADDPSKTSRGDE